MVSPAADGSQFSGGPRSTTTTPLSLCPPEQGLKCPRCDSPNTKFCYYNNYSLTQPRHFCKTCRRYWTQGGALRNVPVGGGCRRNKKSKWPAASTRLPLDPTDHITAGIPEPGGGLKFLTGTSPPPAVDRQLGVDLPYFTRLHAPTTCGVLSIGNQFISFEDLSSTTAAISSPANTMASSMVGFNYPISSIGFYSDVGGGRSSSTMNSNTRSGIASSIESLSSVNQDLHWKLQQQRLAMFFGGEARRESSASPLPTTFLENQPEPISFQVPDDACGNSAGSRSGCLGRTETPRPTWFIESSCTVPASAAATTNSHDNSATKNSNNNCSDNNSSNWNGIPAWNDMTQFASLP